MLTYVSADKRVQWENYVVADEFVTNFKQVTYAISTSTDMIDVLLSRHLYRGVRYLDNTTYKIGYGFGDPAAVQGFTEDDAYAEWIAVIKRKETALKSQLPLDSLPQSVFDALMGLYTDTNNWRQVQADEGTYNLLDAVRNANWKLMADIMSRGIVNPNMRRKEGHVLMLADYAVNKPRQQIRMEGLRHTRSLYSNGIKVDLEKKQAEFSYYRQLGAFLPGMSSLRQRRIVAQAVT